MFLGLLSCLIDGDYLGSFIFCTLSFCIFFLHKNEMVLKSKEEDGITISFSFYSTKIPYEQIEWIEDVEDYTGPSYYNWEIRCFRIKTPKKKYSVHYDKNESDEVKEIFERVGSNCS